MGDSGITRRITLALALLPIAVVLYGLGLPFKPSVVLGLGGPAYHLIVVGTLATVYAVLMRVLEGRAARKAALVDELTGLPGIELFKDRLQQALLLSERDGSHVPLVFMSLNRFSEINQALGRDHGDQLLKELSERFSNELRESDTVARIGGDEFGVLLPSAADGSGAVTVIEKIRQSLTQPFQVDGIPVELTASFGIALSPGHGAHAEALMSSAAAAMVAAKHTGARFQFFSEEYELLPNRVALVAELRRAIERKQLVLFYQPKSCLDGSGIKGVEALVRWIHPETGLIPPDVFIPLAEKTELMRPLTRYVLEEAVRQLSEWTLRGLDITVAVNVSAKNLTDEELPQDVAALLEQWSVPADRLELEITESSMLDDRERSMAVLEQLSAMGVRIAIDDYGAGFTSLSYLTKFPIDALKIDRSFVQNMMEERRDALVVRSTIDLGRSLELDVVAEGVETEEVYNKLAQLGCRMAQGYYIGRPVPAAELPLN